jgi:uncharacterized protein YegL
VFLEAVGDVALATQAEIGVFSYHDGVVPLRELGPHGDDEIWDVGAVDASRISGGSTKSARALNHVFGLIEKRRAELSEEGIPVRAAFVVVLTDGHANDAPADTQAAIAKRKQLEARKDVRVFGIAVGEQADMVQLNELCGPPLALAGMSSFDHLWKWIFQTARTATATRPNDEIEMSNPIAGPANETGFAKHWLRY